MCQNFQLFFKFPFLQPCPSVRVPWDGHVHTRPAADHPPGSVGAAVSCAHAQEPAAQDATPAPVQTAIGASGNFLGFLGSFMFVCSCFLCASGGCWFDRLWDIESSLVDNQAKKFYAARAHDLNAVRFVTGLWVPRVFRFFLFLMKVLWRSLNFLFTWRSRKESREFLERIFHVFSANSWWICRSARIVDSRIIRLSHGWSGTLSALHCNCKCHFAANFHVQFYEEESIGR